MLPLNRGELIANDWSSRSDYAIMRAMDSALVHPTAIIDAQAALGERVSVGPYAVIGAQVVIGDDCHIGAHAVLEGPLKLGPRNRLGPHTILGQPPQDHGYRGEPTELVVGSDNDFREFVTLHRASTKESGRTQIGDRNLLMAYSHVGHDSQLGSDITIANASQLAGHVKVADRAYISALCGVHQFVQIGTLAMLGGGAVVTQDVAPYCMVAGNRARLRGLNSTGLRRAGINATTRRQIKQAYEQIFRQSQSLQAALTSIRADPTLAIPAITDWLAFIENSQRGIIR
jgi:UDP-N-acetylglucosamine acyltransferase